MYGFNHAFWINWTTLCTLFSINPWFNACFKVLMWIVNFFLVFYGTSKSFYLVYIDKLFYSWRWSSEENNTLPFLNVLFIRNGVKPNTAVYRKDTHNDLYLHWNLFTPVSWKRGTLKSLISRGYMVCSNETLLEKEFKHLKHVFHKINGYPW